MLSTFLRPSRYRHNRTNSIPKARDADIAMPFRKRLRHRPSLNHTNCQAEVLGKVNCSSKRGPRRAAPLLPPCLPLVLQQRQSLGPAPADAKKGRAGYQRPPAWERRGRQVRPQARIDIRRPVKATVPGSRNRRDGTVLVATLTN